MLGKRIGIECLTLKKVMPLFDKDNQKARKIYREYIHAKIEDDGPWQDLKGGVILGSYEFADRIKQYLKKHQSNIDFPKRERYANRPGLNEIFGKNSVEDRIRRNKLVCKANLDYGYSSSEIGRFLKLNHSLIGKIVKNYLKTKTINQGD